MNTIFPSCSQPQLNSSLSHVASSTNSSVTELSHFAVLENRDSVAHPLLDHPVHQLPIFGEGVELQNLIREAPLIRKTA